MDPPWAIPRRRGQPAPRRRQSGEVNQISLPPAISHVQSVGSSGLAWARVPVARRYLLIGLAIIVIASMALLLWGIVGDLPYAPDVDEPDFVGAAIRMVQHRTLDPQWFGHPGSTVIYPVAALSAIWYELANHLPPFAHSMGGIGTEFAANPTPFYIIGRLISVAYAVGCVVATWLIGRRIVGDLGGILAALILLTTPLFVTYGQLVRTDLAGLFFSLVVLWLTLRAMEAGRIRDWAFAAASIGLAISTRWFYAVLIVPYVVAAVLWWWREGSPAGGSDDGPKRSWLRPVVALALTPVAFALTSPYVLLRPRKVIADLRAENRAFHPGADGLSPIGNMQWYVFDVIPNALTLLVLVLGAVGIFAAFRVERRRPLVLIAYAASYLVGVSASPLHWNRYAIPLVPIVAIFAAAGALAIADATMKALRRPGTAESSSSRQNQVLVRLRWLPAGIATALVVIAVAPAAMGVAAADRSRATPSTRVVATEWINANLPPTSRIAQEMYTAYLDDRGDHVTDVFALGLTPLATFRSRGIQYLVTSSSMSNRFVDAERYPAEAGFYRSLAEQGRLVASFEPSGDRGGPMIKVYQIGS